VKIIIITPVPITTRGGNTVTARRWSGILRDLGHNVRVRVDYRGEPCDMLVALHARKSHPSIRRFAETHPDRPLIVALTGTDLYGDLSASREARESIEWATRLVLLQPAGRSCLPRAVRDKARVIYQSVVPPRGSFRPDPNWFDACVIANLREVKDPLLAAEATRHLPRESRVRVVHVGEPLDAKLARRARQENRANARYRWVGGMPRYRAMRLLARSRLLVLTSKMEGGANVISEAIALGVPVISTLIDGSIGLLGASYPGYFEIGDARGLARLLVRAETDARFYERLCKRCQRLTPLFDPRRERAAWAGLMDEVAC